MKYFSDFRYVDLLQRNLQSKSKVVVPNFGRFLPSQILLGAGPQKSYPRYHACLPAGHVQKFREVIPTSLE